MTEAPPRPADAQHDHRKLVGQSVPRKEDLAKLPWRNLYLIH